MRVPHILFLALSTMILYLTFPQGIMADLQFIILVFGLFLGSIILLACSLALHLEAFMTLLMISIFPFSALKNASLLHTFHWKYFSLFSKQTIVLFLYFRVHFLFNSNGFSSVLIFIRCAFK